MIITGDNLTNIGVALISFVIAPLTLRAAKEWGKLRNAQRCKCEEAITTLAELQFDHKLLSAHYDDLETVLKRFCEKWRAGKAISETDIEAIEGEMAQRPKRV